MKTDSQTFPSEGASDGGFCPAGDDAQAALGIGLEAQRQAALLEALWAPRAPARAERVAAGGLPAGWRGLPGRAGQQEVAGAEPAAAERGLAAYRRNGWAHAVRALAGVYPVLGLMLGAETLAALAVQLWQVAPPRRGDLGTWGEALAELPTLNDELAEWPWLADLARLEWAVHCAAGASDSLVQADGLVPGLERLGDTDPARLRLVFQPGWACISSRWPVAQLWLAHQAQAGLPLELAEIEARLAGLAPELAAAAEQAGSAQSQATSQTKNSWAALVRRKPQAEGGAVQVEPLQGPAAAFTEALGRGQALGPALASCPGLDFQTWLLRAWREGWLERVQVLEPVQPVPES